MCSGKVQSVVGPSPAPLGSFFPEATSKGRFSPIVRDWRSKALELPWPSCLLPLPGALRPCSAGPRPSGLRPEELNWGPGEVSVTRIVLLSHFPNFPGMPRDLHLCPTVGLPLLPQLRDAKTQGCSPE